jgi:hypothetical protein
MKPSMSAFVVLASLAAAAGCAPLAARSSASVLGPERSSAVVRRAPADAANELVHLLSARGHTLVDHRQRGAVIALRFEGARRMLVDGSYARELGSVYYAFVAPHAGGHSAVTLIGRPTLDGAELCTRDLDLAATGCVERYGDRSHEREVAGFAEAELVHGVFSELRVRGVVDDSVAPAYRLLLARDLCRAQRKEQLERALEHRDVRERARAYARVPTCE